MIAGSGRLRIAALVPTLALAAALAAGCGDDDDAESTDAVSAPAEFGYTGANGPSRWGELDPAYSACSDGARQSPVDLGGAARAPLPEIAFDYAPTDLELTNNGRSVEASVGPGNSITVEGARYALTQFHYHAPSEHRLNGKEFAVELHFVHQSSGGELFVLAALVAAGADNPAFAEIVEALPTGEGESAELGEPVDPSELLPPGFADARRWSYEGSLTTPACSEGVSWGVFERPVRLSEDQISSYTETYSGTNRPIQPLNGREPQLGR